MPEQEILIATEEYSELDRYFEKNGIKKLLLVCGSSIVNLRISHYFETLYDRMGIETVRFSDFKANPEYESVVKGVEVFRRRGCEAIAAVGGGSAMDVAKCIKLYSNMDPGENYLNQPIAPNDIKLLAVPTTAGTGSEATRYAVIYYNGEKQSVADESCIPSAVLMDAGVLKTLPLYQKKSTMMDAVCHAVEAFWSVNSNDESRQYSKQALRIIMDNKERYLANDETGNANMLKAANLAGKAINITQTTAGHAMCYKLTGLYGIAHGHAAALCVAKLWPYMLEHIDRCVDKRGGEYLLNVFKDMSETMGCTDPRAAAEAFNQFVQDLNLDAPEIHDNRDYEVLTASVNPVRLKNNPVRLDEEAVHFLYHQILGKQWRDSTYEGGKVR